MKTGKRKSSEATTNDPNLYRICRQDWGFDESTTQSQAIAALSTRSVYSANTYKAYTNGGDLLDVTDLMLELRKAGEEVTQGNLGRIESMLAHQALTLDVMFNSLAQRAQKQDTYKGIEVLMRLALKAQAQSRSTAEAIAMMKNPMPFIKQANIAHGHQQINNGPTTTHAEKNESARNKLLEGDDGIRMDTRAQAASSRTHQTMEAVGAIKRTKDR